jgi:hypothetical protein
MVVGPADSSASIGLSNVAPRDGESVTLTATVTAAGTMSRSSRPRAPCSSWWTALRSAARFLWPAAPAVRNWPLWTPDHQVTAIFSGSDSFAMGTSPAKPLTSWRLP